MLFPWLQPYYEQFIRTSLSGRAPNSLIVAGHEGVGVNFLALEIAKYYLCHHPTEHGPCGKCTSCSNIARFSHPDMKVAYASAASDVDNERDFDFDLLGLIQREPTTQRRLVRVDTMRKVSEFINESSILGKRKVVIVESADTMNEAAANAILKTFEEPREDTMIIMVTKSLELLLPTILSRASKVVVRDIEIDDAVHYLLNEDNQKPRRAHYLDDETAKYEITREKLLEDCPGLNQPVTKDRAMVALCLNSYAPLKAMDMILSGDDITLIQLVTQIATFVVSPELASPAGLKLIRSFKSLSNAHLCSLLKELVLEILKYKAHVDIDELPLIKYGNARNLSVLSADQLFEVNKKIRFIEENNNSIAARAPNAVSRAWIYALTKNKART